MTKYIIK